MTVSDLAAKKWPSIAAIYRVVDAQGEPLYQSTTLNLARRIKNQFSRKAWKQLEPWCGPAESLRLEWKVIDISLARPVQQMAGLLTVPTPLNLYLDLD